MRPQVPLRIYAPMWGPASATNPEAVGKCTMERIWRTRSAPWYWLLCSRHCVKAGLKSTEIGVNKVTVAAGPEGVRREYPTSVEGITYNLVQPQGRASDFGVALKLPIALTGAAQRRLRRSRRSGGRTGGRRVPLASGTSIFEARQYFAHTFIEGGVEWAGNYHDYYEIDVSPALPLISSRLILDGNIGTDRKGGFITLPSQLCGRRARDHQHGHCQIGRRPKRRQGYVTPIPTEGCNGASPFLIRSLRAGVLADAGNDAVRST